MVPKRAEQCCRITRTPHYYGNTVLSYNRPERRTALFCNTACTKVSKSAECLPVFAHFFTDLGAIWYNRSSPKSQLCQTSQ